ncbi:MAG: histidine kinase dimerization/phosphoacceptor domain -containing protein, partial [Methanobacterium sp.]
VLVSYISILSWINESYLKMVFSDVISPIIEIVIALCVFYAAKLSSMHRRVQIAWTILGVSVLFYAVGDIIWAIMELFLHQQPFPSIADFFYLSFFPLFALGIYYLPKISLSRNEELKLIIDTTILVITVSLILWIFLIMPTIYSNNELLSSIISIAYIVGDIALLFALIRILFGNFKNTYRGPLILLGMAIIMQIITDSIYSYQSLQGTYLAGGILDAGWVLCFLFIGLAAILQVNDIGYGQKERIKIGSWIQNFSFPSYLPILSVAIAYILLIWTSYNMILPNLMYVEIGVGVTIFLVLLRQVITLDENKELFSAAKKEIENRKKAEKDLIESKNHFQSIFDNAPIGIYHSSPQGKLYGANQSLSDILGYRSPEEFVSILNKSSLGEHVWVDKELRLKIVGEALNDNSWHTHECKFFKKDGNIIIVELSMKSVNNADGSLKYLEGFIKDITERKGSEEALRESRAKLKITMDMSKLVQWEYDVESDLFNFDDQFYSLYGTSVEREGGTQMSSEEYAGKFLPLEESSIIAQEFIEALKTDDPNYFNQIEHGIIRADGEKRFITVRIGVIKDNKGSTIKIYGANQDITELKQAENDLKSSLKEKEILLKEIHHRVKNNMQIISSLLNLQLANVDDNQALDVLKESQGRIKSMALVHENLYLSDVLASINFKEYIQKLVMDLIVTYKADFIELKLNIDDIYLNIETATPCGLIINELVTNSIKHAFSKPIHQQPTSPEAESTITIGFTENKDEFKLTVQDNGMGLPESYGNSKSLGLRLVRVLVEQLNGAMEINRENGTTFTIIFKELDYKKRV